MPLLPIAVGLAILLFVYNRVGEPETMQRGGFGTSDGMQWFAAIVGGMAIVGALILLGATP